MSHLKPSRLSTTTTLSNEGRSRGADKNLDSPEDPKQVHQQGDIGHASLRVLGVSAANVGNKAQ